MKVRGAVLTGLLLVLPLAQMFSLQTPVTFMSPAESIVKLKGDLKRDTIDGSRNCHITVPSMKMDVAPQVIQAFPTAEEQNKCLAVVSGAVAALQASDKVQPHITTCFPSICNAHIFPVWVIPGPTEEHHHVCVLRIHFLCAVQ